MKYVPLRNVYINVEKFEGKEIRKYKDVNVHNIPSEDLKKISELYGVPIITTSDGKLDYVFLDKNVRVTLISRKVV